MRLRFVAAGLAAGMVTASQGHTATAQKAEPGATPSESRIPVGGARLYARVVGQGPAVVVLHGGPDFDHGYLLPDLDRLKDGFRLIYYDQRGRGKSAEHVQPGDVTLASDVDDLDKLRRHFRLDAPTLLGHSWGALLALEYAVRHPTRVSSSKGTRASSRRERSKTSSIATRGNWPDTISCRGWVACASRPWSSRGTTTSFPSRSPSTSRARFLAHGSSRSGTAGTSLISSPRVTSTARSTSSSGTRVLRNGRASHRRRGRSRSRRRPPWAGLSAASSASTTRAPARTSCVSSAYHRSGAFTRVGVASGAAVALVLRGPAPSARVLGADNVDFGLD